MRLSTLNPELDENGDGSAYLSFDCPTHGPGALRDGFPDRVQIKIALTQSQRVWGWNGEKDFEKMVLTPSIHMHGHWHGYVGGSRGQQPGEVTTV